MGVVYKAQDTKLDRFVALKFLPAHLAESEGDKARFIQEARAASALNHPNVCTIHDIQEYDGPAPAGKQMFLVMEFVDGRTLREMKSSITLKQALEIGTQVADGLAAAHEKGIVHRDIKPENIMIRKDGIAQIMDFGLAKFRASGSKITRLTKEGSTIGTAGYMSPEQIQGMDVDHRSDIFSYGVVLYELIAGEPPFKGVHETALMYEIVNVDPAPISAVKPEIDPGIDAIVLECLEKDPNERTQSVKQVSIDLKRFKRESTKVRTTRTMATRQFATSAKSAAAEEPIRRGRSSRLWMGATAVLAVIVVVLGWQIWKGGRTVSQLPMHLAVDLRPYTASAGYGQGNTGLAISRDGRYVAYTGGPQSNPQIFLRRLDQNTVEPLAGTNGSLELCFSPDGDWIAFAADNKIKTLSIHGGAPQSLCTTQGVTRGMDWAADGNIYFGVITEGVYRIASGGGTPELVTYLDSTNAEISDRYPQLLPDGKTVLFTIKQNTITSFSDALIAVEKIGSRDKKVVLHGGSYARYVPTGHIVYLHGDYAFAAPFDIDKLEVTGPPVQLFEGGWLNEGSGAGELSFSAGGTLVYAPSGAAVFTNIALDWMNRQGKVRPLVDSLRPYYGAALSPDGEKLAVSISAANDDIWIYQIKRGIMTRLTFGGGNSDNVIWSPDGQYVVYYSEKGKVPNIFRKRWDGSAPEERLTQSPHAQTPESFTPDGKYMSFNEDGDIWILPMTGDRKPWAFLQTPAFEGNTSFSPDGQWISYVSDESGKPEVYVAPFPNHNGKWQISTGGGTGAEWTRDGKQLIYLSGNALMAVDVTTKGKFDYSTPKLICAMPPSSIGPFDISPDGKEFIIGVTDNEKFTLDHMNVVVNWFDELKAKVEMGRN